MTVKQRAVKQWRRTGILGGTFNPVHIGHLHIAQEVLIALELERVVFIPNRFPPHRTTGSDLLDEEHRFAMVQIAVASNPRFFVSRVELERDGLSYSVDTVEALCKTWPQIELFFITGADALLSYVWKDFDRMLGMLAALVAVTRPGFNLDVLNSRLDVQGLQHRNRVRILEIAGYAVTGTEIRERAARGVSLCYLVPREVEDYIGKFGLYKEGAVS